MLILRRARDNSRIIPSRRRKKNEGGSAGRAFLLPPGVPDKEADDAFCTAMSLNTDGAILTI
jgi:hypothetical protein